MKNIIFVAYEFPPLNSGGSHRPLKFIKNLRRFDVNPIVITVSDYESGRIDHALEQEIPKNITVIRTQIRPPGVLERFKNTGYFSVLDTVGERWFTFLDKAIADVQCKYGCDTLVVTAPPFSVLMTCFKVSKKRSLKFIPDFRDAWSQWVITPFASYYHYKKIYGYEKEILKNSYLVSMATPQLRRDVIHAHKDINASKIITILNSIGSEIKEFQAPTLNKEKIVIGYVGTYYYDPVSHRLTFSKWWQRKPYQYLQFSPRIEDYKYRSPYFFFRILSAFFRENPDFKKRIFFHHVGNIPYWLEEMIAKFDLQENVKLIGFKPQSYVKEFVDSCDLMLSTSIKVINGRDYCIAGKTYEYFAAGKPIIGVVAEGDQKDMLKRVGTSLVLDPDNVDMSVDEFLKFLSGEINFTPDNAYLCTLTADNTAKKLAEMVKS